MKLHSFFFILLISQTGLGAESGLTLTEVIFNEVEPGLEPYRSRILLNEQLMRLDGNNDQGDFILYDRKSREIHSFNHQDKTHLIMKPLQTPMPDVMLDFQVAKKILVDAPKINGQVPVEIKFYADTHLCKKSINVPNFLPEVTIALINYQQALVEQNIQTLPRIPASMRSSCYMANNYLHASDYLKVGFPVHVIDDQGRQKKLLSFRQVIKPGSLFQQPEGYQSYYPNPSNL